VQNLDGTCDFDEPYPELPAPPEETLVVNEAGFRPQPIFACLNRPVVFGLSASVRH